MATIRRKTRDGVVRVCGVALIGLLAAAVNLACGPVARPAPVEPAVTETTRGADDSILATLRQIAATVAPMPIYGWPHLPEGASVADEWWPVIDLDSPGQYGEGPTPNPRVTGVDTGQTQVQLVLRVGDAWVVLVENFRGDLGDVQGKFVGEVGDREANLYSVAGGHLVQWSDGGRWYGVFGRGLSDAELVRLALETQVISPGENDNRD
jgi:hypothetical protein